MNKPKIIVSTSDRYHHCLRIFIYLFNRNWSDKQHVEIVGYKHPDFELPSNFTFYSMGEQGSDPSCFSGDLRGYFSEEDKYFIWLFEDSFIKGVNLKDLDFIKSLLDVGEYGRIDLGDQCMRGCNEELIGDWGVYQYCQDRNYRLSTQPSIWNKEFLLKYLQEGLSPWDFERQHPINDGWAIIGLNTTTVTYNEGVTKKDIFAYNLDGVPQEQIDEMKQLNII